MYQEQRLNAIMENISKRGEISVVEAMKLFNVSRDTIRRDFTILSEKKLAKRTHGGLVAYENNADILSFNERLLEMSKEKINIAKKAEKYIVDGGIYFFDVSTTVLALAQMIDENKKITVYSHSLDLAILFSNKKNIDFHLIGGKFYFKNRFYFSLNEAELLKGIKFTVGLFGAAGIKDGEVSFENEEDVFIKKIALAQSTRKLLLAQSTKKNLGSTYILGKLEDFDQFISEKN